MGYIKHTDRQTERYRIGRKKVITDFVIEIKEKYVRVYTRNI